MPNAHYPLASCCRACVLAHGVVVHSSDVVTAYKRTSKVNFELRSRLGIKGLSDDNFSAIFRMSVHSLSEHTIHTVLLRCVAVRNCGEDKTC